MSQASTSEVQLRAPNTEDGQRVWQLIKACPPLECNTEYAYLLLCTHFKGTCAIAELEGELVGCVLGYTLPERPEVIFVWQVGVAEAGRGRGLGKALLKYLLLQDACREVTWLETTVSPSNTASRKLFEGLARDLKTDISEEALFSLEHFSGSEHEEERLLRIGVLR